MNGKLRLHLSMTLALGAAIAACANRGSSPSPTNDASGDAGTAGGATGMGGSGATGGGAPSGSGGSAGGSAPTGLGGATGAGGMAAGGGSGVDAGSGGSSGAFDGGSGGSIVTGLGGGIVTGLGGAGQAGAGGGTAGDGGAGGGSGGLANGGGGGVASGGSGGAAGGGSGGAAGGTAASGGHGGSAGAGGGNAGTTGAAGAGGGTGASYPYIFSTFNDSAAGNTTLLIYTSTDALNFKLLSDTKYGGPTGTLRDPSIMKHTDGKYYVTFTTPPDSGCCGPESSFSLAVSSDLVHWTTLTTVPSGVAGVVNTWAPEFFKDADGSINIVASVDTGAASSFQSYKYTAKNAALTSWSGPTPIGIGPNHIDTFIVTVGATYHAFTKNETTLYIEHATATSLSGPWTFVGTGNWAGWGVHREAPALIHLPNGTWRIYVDGGSQGHEMYSDSTDTFATWTALKPLPAINAIVSHGTVITGN